MPSGISCGLGRQGWACESQPRGVGPRAAFLAGLQGPLPWEPLPALPEDLAQEPLTTCFSPSHGTDWPTGPGPPGDLAGQSRVEAAVGPGAAGGSADCRRLIALRADEQLVKVSSRGERSCDLGCKRSWWKQDTCSC